MDKAHAIEMIDNHKNKLVNPVEMLDWTWLRVILLKLDDDAWNKALEATTEVMSR